MNTPLPLPQVADPQDLAVITCCPRCRAGLFLGSDLWLCSAPDCTYAVAGFPVVSGQPVLVDFERSVFLRVNYEHGRGLVQPRDDTGRTLRTRLRKVLTGSNEAAPHACQDLMRRLMERAPHPLVLVVGGGAIGSGMEALYSDPRIRVVGTDVYASANTRLVADGHGLPFHDGIFDAVLIQAVLEHVLEPQRVVDEIHRVLRPDGLLYAETPFMQQVHEGAYDFTRFTRSGHRWLFRRFAEIEAGSIGGVSMPLVWSIRYFLRALGCSPPIATLAMLPFVWLRLFDRFGRKRAIADAASGHYFLGRRAASQTLREIDMVAYYESQNATDRTRG